MNEIRGLFSRSVNSGKVVKIFLSFDVFISRTEWVRLKFAFFFVPHERSESSILMELELLKNVISSSKSLTIRITFLKF